jgi:hypothetical protein
VSIPAERALTVYVDKREPQTDDARRPSGAPCTLPPQPEAGGVSPAKSSPLPWIGLSALWYKTRHGIADIEEKTAKR